MKTTKGVRFPINRRAVRMDVSRCRLGSLLPTLLLACAALAGSGGGFNAAAQFPAFPCNSSASTFGCFQITVDPHFYGLLNASGGNGAYPGWDGTTYLTSPGMGDDPTQTPNGAVFGESAGLSSPPAYNGPYAAIGVAGVCGSCNVSGYAYTPPNGTSPYIFPFPLWQYPAVGDGHAMLTEIQDFYLTSGGAGTVSVDCPPGQNSLIPPSGYGAGNALTVVAGYDNIPDNARRCLGMMVSTTVGSDFPAQSFFDVYVQVTLPSVPSTVSGSAFPAGGLLLTNSAGYPLIVTSSGITGVPPSAACASNIPSIFYTHSPASTAANLYVANSTPFPNPSGGPAFYPGQYFGSIQLAGHGIFEPCDPGNPSAAWTNFITTVMGTVGHRAQAAPVGGTYPGTDYLWPGCTYAMSGGTNFAGQPWDAMTWTNVTGISAANLTLSNFLFPISLPSYGNTVLYTNTNTVITLGWSANGLTNYISTQATNTVVVQIQNTNTANTSNAITGITTYNLQLMQFAFSSTAFFGPYMLEINPSIPTIGTHTVHNQKAGYNISSFLDTYLQWSLNGGTSWYTNDAPVRLSLGNPPCGAVIEPIYVTQNGANAHVDWANSSYTLQYNTSLTNTNWINIAGAPPIDVPETGTNKLFFRLICD